MRKLLIPLVTMLLAQEAGAQQFYFRGGVGYAISHGGVAQSTLSGNTSSVYPIHGSYSTTRIPGTEIESFNLKRASYSSGLQGILAIGAMFGKNVGTEIAAHIGLQTRSMNADVYIEQPEIREWLAVTQQADLPVFITPSLVIQSDTAQKFIAYARGGVVLPVKSGITQEANYAIERYNQQDNSWVRNTADWTEDFEMRFNPGVSGSIGLKYKAKKGVMLWAELYLLSMNLFFKKSELTSYAQDGVSVLNLLTTDQKITNYEFESNNSGATGAVPTYQVPFSNFGFHAGVMVDLK